MEILFEKERDTKNTVRYAEVVPETSDAIVGTLYVRKSVAAGLGDKIKVTIEKM